MSTKRRNTFLIIVIVVILACIIAALPPVRERLLWRADRLWTQAFYLINPPEKEAFIPNTPETDVSPMSTATITATIVNTPSPTPLPEVDTPTPIPTATPLPQLVELSGVEYVDQHGLFNYCAPANLVMALTYWGWEGDRVDIGQILKPYPEDFNVMLYEMVDYVQDETNLNAILRSGGTIEQLKILVAGGFPVLLETGRHIVDLSGKLSWMGHYTVLTGYNDETQEFITQDSYYTADYPITYDELLIQWRAFNFAFLIVYPPDQQGRLFELLGDYADEEQSNRIAYDIATNEIWSQEDVDKLFAWFNRGTSMIALKDYRGAAESFDEAFLINAGLPESERPWRMMWYQTGPYFAYYNTGRYQDVIDLADFTLDKARLKILEESYIWRARAYAALGNLDEAHADLCSSLKYHQGFEPALQELQNLGLSDCP
ncbi:MAG: C39 family peptidase [Anaerolineaceae bacterium]|nr:C39 family peptidase [Anaerolineaceae bacterium]